jgi:hypothetical protein
LAGLRINAGELHGFMVGSRYSQTGLVTVYGEYGVGIPKIANTEIDVSGSAKLRIGGK